MANDSLRITLEPGSVEPREFSNFHNYFTDNKSKSNNKIWSSTHERTTKFSEPSLHTRVSTIKPHARAPAPPTPARGSRGGVVVCAPARRRPTETGLPRPNCASIRGGSGASGSAASRGSGWGPGPRGWPSGPHRATAPRAAGSAARGRQVRRAAGWGDERGPRSGRGLKGAASGEEKSGLAPAAARHVRRAGCLC